MERPTLTLIIPTISRPTLARTLLSVRLQDWWPGDQIILVGDGPQPIAGAMWAQLELPGEFVEVPRTDPPDWGHTPRNRIRAKAKGEYLVALDDDDEFTPDAIKTVRAALVENPGVPHLFKMNTPDNGDVWKAKQITVGNVGTPMFVTPNVYEKLGCYTSRYGGDHDFIKSTVERFGAVVWRDEVICRVRPQGV